MEYIHILELNNHAFVYTNAAMHIAKLCHYHSSLCGTAV